MKHTNVKVLTKGELLSILLAEGTTPADTTPVRLVDDMFPGTADYKMGHLVESTTEVNGEMVIIARGNGASPVHKDNLAK
jgi:hypothetical protein